MHFLMVLFMKKRTWTIRKGLSIHTAVIKYANYTMQFMDKHPYSLKDWKEVNLIAQCLSTAPNTIIWFFYVNDIILTSSFDTFDIYFYVKAYFCHDESWTYLLHKHVKMHACCNTHNWSQINLHQRTNSCWPNLLPQSCRSITIFNSYLPEYHICCQLHLLIYESPDN